MYHLGWEEPVFLWDYLLILCCFFNRGHLVFSAFAFCFCFCSLLLLLLFASALAFAPASTFAGAFALALASAFAIANRQLETLQVLLQNVALFTAQLAALLAVARVYRARVAASGQLPILRWLQ